MTLLLASNAMAGYTCTTLIVSPISVTYDPASSASATGSYNVTCMRATTNDPASLTFTLSSNGGSHNVPKNTLPDNVALTTDVSKKLQYSLLTNGADWFDSAPQTRITDTMTFAPASLTANTNGTFSFRMAIGQPVPKAGTYQDTVNVNLRTVIGGNSSTPILTTTFDINVTTLESCVLSRAPGNIQFDYTSFQTSTSDAPATSFDVNCTKGTSYVMSIDAYTGTLLNLAYALKLPIKNAIGTGLAQTFSLGGSMAAGQSGTCASASCTGTDVRTLTITY